MSGGYGRPPKSRQFKKGQSGNPRGRPKMQPEMSRAYLFRKVVKETICVKTASGEKIMTRWEALVRMVQSLALNKNSSAARLLHKMRKEFSGNALPSDTRIWIVSEADLRV
jgi:hypothetical protein